MTNNIGPNQTEIIPVRLSIYLPFEVGAKPNICIVDG